LALNFTHTFAKTILVVPGYRSALEQRTENSYSTASKIGALAKYLVKYFLFIYTPCTGALEWTHNIYVGTPSMYSGQLTTKIEYTNFEEWTSNILLLI
jgi:hypothetical protein